MSFNPAQNFKSISGAMIWPSSQIFFSMALGSSSKGPKILYTRGLSVLRSVLESEDVLGFVMMGCVPTKTVSANSSVLS